MYNYTSIYLRHKRDLTVDAFFLKRYCVLINLLFIYITLCSHTHTHARTRMYRLFISRVQCVISSLFFRCEQHLDSFDGFFPSKEVIYTRLLSLTVSDSSFSRNQIADIKYYFCDISRSIISFFYVWSSSLISHITLFLALYATGYIIRPFLFIARLET